MKFTLEIELGNDAMQSYADIARALKSTIRDGKPSDYPHRLEVMRLPKTGDYNSIRDLNGNTVGKWEVTEEAPPREAEQPAELLTKLAELQTEFWNAAGQLETVLGIEIDTTQALSGMTVEDLKELHNGE